MRRQRELDVPALQKLPVDERALLEDVLGAADPELLAAVERNRVPSSEQAERVMDVLLAAFLNTFDPDSEPTERGKRIDDVPGPRSDSRAE